ncbi:MAG: hypothetical protein ACXWTS_11220, partial [Methylococcaceae bacterium]
ILAQDFYSYSRRINRRIASYVTVDTTQKTDKKTSQNVQVIKLPFLSMQGFLMSAPTCKIPNLQKIFIGRF